MDHISATTWKTTDLQLSYRTWSRLSTTEKVTLPFIMQGNRPYQMNTWTKSATVGRLHDHDGDVDDDDDDDCYEVPGHQQLCA